MMYSQYVFKRIEGHSEFTTFSVSICIIGSWTIINFNISDKYVQCVFNPGACAGEVIQTVCL